MLNSCLKENLNCQDLSVCKDAITLITIAICNYVFSHTGKKIITKLSSILINQHLHLILQVFRGFEKAPDEEKLLGVLST